MGQRTGSSAASGSLSHSSSDPFIQSTLQEGVAHIQACQKQSRKMAMKASTPHTRRRRTSQTVAPSTSSEMAR